MSDLENTIVSNAADILVNSFSKYNSEGEKIDKKVIGFWSKFKRRLDTSFIEGFEQSPVQYREKLIEVLLDLKSVQSVQFNMIMLLESQGYSIKDFENQ